MARHHMSAVDSAWLRMDTPGNLLVINSVMWMSGECDFAALRATIQERITDRFPRFKQFPRRPGNPLGRAEWVDDEDFDPDRHYRMVTLPAPGDQAALEAYVSSQVGLPLAPDQPPWEVHLIDGFADGAAVMFRIHHAVADGISLMRVTLSLTDEGPAKEELFAPDHDPGSTQAMVQATTALLGQGLGLVRHPSRVGGLVNGAVHDAARLVHLTLLPPQKRSVLSGGVQERKLVTWTPPISLAEVKAVGRATDTTVNDVLLAALAGAFSSYLDERGTPLDVLRVMVPVNLRPLDAPLPSELGNEFGFYFVDLPTAPMAPHERLAEMHRHTEEIKGSPEAVVAFGVLAGLGAMPQPVEELGVAFFGSKAAGVVTNVPGPTETVRLAGAPVAGMVAWVPRAGDMGFGVAISSYAGSVFVGFSTDAELIPDPERLQHLMVEQVQTLLALAPAAR